MPDRLDAARTPIDHGGLVVACAKCGEEAVLPYTGPERASVCVTLIEGWSSPPLLCQWCSNIARRLAAALADDD